jgi:hypothetical protein
MELVKVYGESAAVDPDIVEGWTAVLKDFLQRY